MCYLSLVVVFNYYLQLLCMLSVNSWLCVRYNWDDSHSQNLPEVLLFHSSNGLCYHLSEEWLEEELYWRKNTFFKNPFAQGNVLWMCILVGLILLYSWALRMSSLPAYTQHSLFYPTICTFGRRVNAVSSLIRHTHSSRRHTVSMLLSQNSFIGKK